MSEIKCSNECDSDGLALLSLAQRAWAGLSHWVLQWGAKGLNTWSVHGIYSTQSVAYQYE
jgi:hypothetical protein